MNSTNIRIRLLLRSAFTRWAFLLFITSVSSVYAAKPNQMQRLSSLHQVPEGLSNSEWHSIRAAYEAGRHALKPAAEGWHAHNPGQQWTTHFDKRGFTTRPQDGRWSWGLQLQSYGFGEEQTLVCGTPTVQAAGQRLSYQWDAAVQEWFVNDQRGLEHGFIMERRPTGQTDQSELSFTLTTRGDLFPRVSTQGVTFENASGASVMNYSGLKVWDADGTLLPARFEPAGGKSFRLLVDERGARYPITIDPIAQQAYLKASNTRSGQFFGWAVALSGDTLVVGAHEESSNAKGVNAVPADYTVPGAGAAYVFIRSSSGWSQQAYLKASNTGAQHHFGYSVAISGDTLVVGAYGESSDAIGVGGDGLNNRAPNAGAAYVFTRKSGAWSQQAYLKASNTAAQDMFGWSVAISKGSVVVGALQEDSNATGVNAQSTGGRGTQEDNSMPGAGAAYVFTNTSGAWTQQAYLKAGNTGSDARFGSSVAISGDTLVVGAYGESRNTGAAYVFTRNSGVWSQQGNYLKASKPTVYSEFGNSVAVSEDMNTVVIGARWEDSNATGVDAPLTGGLSTQEDQSASKAGAAYVFTRADNTWSQQAYLKASNTGSDNNFGSSVAVSGDTVVVGAPGEDSNAKGVQTGGSGIQTDNHSDYGAAYVFTRNGKTWSPQAYLKASNPDKGDCFGQSVTVASGSVVVGAYGEGSMATGVDGNQTDNNGANCGATYVYSGFPVPKLSNNANLASLINSTGTLSPDFVPNTTTYTASVPSGTNQAILVISPAESNATLQIRTNSRDTFQQSAQIKGSFGIPLRSGVGYFEVQVTAPDGQTKQKYIINISEAPPLDATLTASFSKATDVGTEASSYTATGKTLNLTLGYEPKPGAILTVVNNTGLDFIGGYFNNYKQGQVVPLLHKASGKTYSFVANYFGGTGNDLVLQWADTQVMDWGYNSVGQLGNNSLTDSSVPTAVSVPNKNGALTGKNIIAVEAGDFHNLALCSDGTLAAWGSNGYGQLGNNTTTDSPVPVTVIKPTGLPADKIMIAVSTGAHHSLALYSDGTVYAWGYNSSGQLGDNSGQNRSTPVAVTGLSSKKIVAISAGATHSLALCSDSTVYAWGYNSNGQLGNNSLINSSVPAAVTGLSSKKVIAISAGGSHSMALCFDGTVMAWGLNDLGQLGNNSTTRSPVPVSVHVPNKNGALTGTRVIAISAAPYHSLALCANGTLAAWGANDYGQLGNGLKKTSPVPVAVKKPKQLLNKTFIAISGGMQHSQALCTDGTLFSWGRNNYGQLGDASKTNRLAPVQVALPLPAGSLFMASSMAASLGSYHSIGVLAKPLSPP